jgi:hypothetical protein
VNPVRAKFSAPIQNDPEDHPAPYTFKGRGNFSRIILGYILIIDLTTGYIKSIHRLIHG